ncbi:MAG TPA: hypothetical protein PKC25_03855 [Candidatus Rifleibacterium sp.]|jgi:flagellar motility protein MotE (MotC chaperone)|nr:hypothetical protein [Candidatus Rifleibacterium sp.]
MPENEVNQSKPAAAREDTEQAQIRPPSRIYLALSRIIYMFLLASLGVATFLTVLTLDFLQIYPFRYKIPEEYRKYWPLSSYYDFVQLHQLPEEERYQQLILQEQERFNRLITEGSRDLERRAVSLEESYRALMRTQKEQHQRELEELRKQRETIELEKKNLANDRQDLENRKIAVDELSQRLASETLNIESSLIRFMEKENRLDQVRSIAAQMEPKALARIFDDVPDDQLIYDILGGLQPSHSGKILGGMDPEKAGRIMKLGKSPLTLPEPGPSRNYIPPSLQNLINDTQANLR